MLALLISITRNINDELADTEGRPSGIEFVDWPFLQVEHLQKKLNDCLINANMKV
jgi:hypothetical protein